MVGKPGRSGRKGDPEDKALLEELKRAHRDLPEDKARDEALDRVFADIRKSLGLDKDSDGGGS